MSSWCNRFRVGVRCEFKGFADEAAPAELLDVGRTQYPAAHDLRGEDTEPQSGTGRLTMPVTLERAKGEIGRDKAERFVLGFPVRLLGVDETYASIGDKVGGIVLEQPRPWF